MVETLIDRLYQKVFGLPPIHPMPSMPQIDHHSHGRRRKRRINSLRRSQLRRRSIMSTLPPHTATRHGHHFQIKSKRH